MMRALHAFFMALGMFTALPCPYRPWDESARGMMTACLPVVGAVLGLVWAALAMLARWLLPEALCAAVIVAVPMLSTGFIHLDGFMDTCDALLSWRPLEERLRILKDSHTGAYAVVSLALWMLFAFAAALSLDKANLRALALIPVVSRCGSALCVTTLKPIGHSEYARMARPDGAPEAVAVMLALTLLIGGLWLGKSALCLIVEAAAYAAAMAWAVRTLGGVSGDLAGFALSVSEVCALAALAML